MKLKAYVIGNNEIELHAHNLSYTVLFNGVTVEFFSYFDADQHFFDLIKHLQVRVA